MSTALLEVDGASKRFKLYDRARDRVADWLHLARPPRYREFWALRDVSFQVQPGESVGVVGPNGAGKSTLLKLISGVLPLTSGKVHLRGQVLSLLELGTGFNPALSGRENVAQSAALLGYDRSFAARHAETIRDFAELGSFFERPVREYSSGMFVRLAFSLFSVMQPELFVVDEALAVGDLRFAAKAVARIREMAAQGTTLLFVSHDLHLVTQLCTRALWLHGGSLQMDGPAADVTRAYRQFTVTGASRPRAVSGAAAAPESGSEAPPPRLCLGGGWYPLEAYAGEVFRWGRAGAEVVVMDALSTPRVVELDIEPGPRLPGPPVRLHATSGGGVVLAELPLDARGTCPVMVPAGPAGQRVQVRASILPSIAPGDHRQLNLRLLGAGWAGAGPPTPTASLPLIQDPEGDQDLAHATRMMHAALQGCPPAPGAPARITNVRLLNALGAPATAFRPYDGLVAEVVISADRDVQDLVTGVQVRDLFDRRVWAGRSDWQGRQPLALKAGERATVSFRTDRLILGDGWYQITARWHLYPHEMEPLQWVDGAWTFEVLPSEHPTFLGLADLGWHYEAHVWEQPATEADD
ncbi:MAG: ABC transporter ATP-binding protein [Chloroflexi bacterium]|nr:ABC transporter ATP-binding protein [Chloroflexota bacterium]